MCIRDRDSLTSITKDDNKPQVYTDYSKDANKSSSTGVTTLDNLFDDNSDTETKVDNTTTLMFKFTDKKAVRMLTLTSSKSGRTPDRAQAVSYTHLAGGWEQFRVINNSDGTVSFQSCLLYTSNIQNNVRKSYRS